MLHRANRRGYSLIEILMVVIIVALLATISLPLYGLMRDRATLAGCLSNMRIVGLGLNSFMQDHNMVWPQVPTDMLTSNKQRSKWWHDTLFPYDVAQKHWICPNDLSTTNTAIEGSDFVSSYAVVTFDEYPNTAFRWKQPWAMERMGAHGASRGGNLLMPDGTIQEGYAFPSAGQ